MNTQNYNEMNLGKLKDAWIEAGSKTSDLQNELSIALLDDDVSAEQVKDLQIKVEAATAKRDGLKQQADRLENQQVEKLKNKMNTEENTMNFINTTTGQNINILNKHEKLTDKFSTNEKINADLGKMVKGMITGKWENASEEQKIVAMNTNGDGNVLIPTPLSNSMIDLVRAKSVLSQAGVPIIPMDSSTLTVAKQESDVPTNWKKEGEAIQIGDPTFSPVVFSAKTLVGMCKVSVEMLEDAQNIGELISNSLVESLALNLDRAGIIGSGVDPEPRGLYNLPSVTKQTIKSELKDYKSISKAITTILTANGEPNSIIMNPSVYGELDNLTDTTGQPLNAPQSFNGLINKLTTTQIPSDLGDKQDGSFAIVGDFTKLWLGVRTNVVLEVTRTGGGVFDTLEYAVRAYLRADFQPVQESHFVILDDIK